VRVTTVVQRTPSTITFLQYAPTDPSAVTATVPATAYSTTGVLNNPLPVQPVNAYSDAYTLPGTIPTVEATVYHGGQPLIIKLEDLDQNIDPAVVEQVWVRISCAETGGDELLLLTEDGADSGVFYGYVWTEITGDTARDGILAVTTGCTLTASYSDAADGQDVSVDAALTDPYGFVFDSVSGTLLNGAIVTLWDVALDAPANVFDDFGNPGYPATVTTGDPGLNFPTGGFRFPLIEPGREYRLDIQPPVGHTAPSGIDGNTLRNRFGSQFLINDTASYGDPFFVNPGPAIHIDIPADPAATGLWLQKESGKQSVSAGDFLQYTLNLENLDGSNSAPGIILEDRLPKGFRYQDDSLRINGRKAPDPEIQESGRMLIIPIGDMALSESVEVTYVVEIGAGAELGKAVNKAYGVDQFGNSSNQATAEVIVRDDFFRNETFLMGRVMIGTCEQLDTEMPGLVDARIYLEDGSYVLTDENGNYHFEGIDQGVHVVQLDLDTIPEQFEVVTCEDNTQFASRSHSQFVDLQGGTIWRTDFHLAQRQKARGEVHIELNSSIDEEIATFQIPVAVGQVPLDDLRLSVILPDGLDTIPGSSKLDEGTISGPERRGQLLTYRLGDKPAGWRGTVTVETRDNGRAHGEMLTKAVLTFNSPEQNNQRTPMAENLLIVKTHEDNAENKNLDHAVRLEMVKAHSGPQATATIGRRPGDEQVTEAGIKSADKIGTMPTYDTNWLAKAEPGLEWLWPQEDTVPSIPSIKVAIKHPGQHKVTLLHEGQPVSPLTYEGTTTDSTSGLAVSRWRGVDVNLGDNNFTAIVTDHNGQQTEQLVRNVHYSYAPVNATFIPEQSRLLADGKNPIVIAVRLTDMENYPVQQGLVGEYSVDAPYVAEINHDEIDLNGYTNKPKFKVGADGIARIVLAPTTRSGKATVSVPLEAGRATISTWVEAAPRDWILVGFAEGTAGYNALSGNDVSLEEAGIDEHYFDDGQVKFFAKGAIKGEWLLTMAYDSDKPDLDGDSLYQVIDPDTYYPLYGDGTQQGYEASSASHLYVKLEREQFYALFGDMNTGLDQTELSRYNRTMNGFKSEMETENFTYTIFAANTKQAFVKDEILGDGTSGRYYLSESDLVINSEIVTIETRDRFHSERVLDTQTLARHTDYDIDYDDGSLFFKRPIPSRDERFDHIYIVVRYETQDSSEENINYGGRAAALLFNGRVEAGATYVHEENGNGDGDLYGTDVTVRLTPTTTLHAEAATTDTSHYDDRSGDAYLAEVTHDSNRVTGRAYYREQQEGFGLGQQNGTETGTRKYGLQGYYNLTPAFSLGGQAYHEDNLATSAERDVAEVTGNYSRNNFGIYSGVREAKDSFDNAEEQRSTQWMVGGNWATPDRRLNLRADYEQSLRGKNENSDYPTLLTLGADYKLTQRISLFAEQEFTWGKDLDTDSTRAGLMVIPWKGADLHSTVEQQTNENGQRVFALFGLGQTWTVNQYWSFDANIDRSQMMKSRNEQLFNTNVPPAHGSDEDFTAVSFGSTYREARWTWWNRIETRHADSEDRYGISTSVVAEPQPGVAVAAKALAFITDAEGGARRTDGNIRLGMAYRPTASRWIVLERLDYYFDQEDHSASDYDNWRIVNNLHANFKYDRKLQTSFYYGAKYVRDSYDSGTYSGYTDLFASETRYNIHKQWDIGAHGSMLHSWNSHNFQYGLGADIGFSPVTNTWISLGYNVFGFEDDDFSDANYTAKGIYIRFRVKFDQQSVREAAAWLNQ